MKILLEIIMVVLKPLFEALAPLIMKEMDDTCEDGTDKDKENWNEVIEDSWSDEAIEATNPKEK